MQNRRREKKNNTRVVFILPSHSFRRPLISREHAAGRGDSERVLDACVRAAFRSSDRSMFTFIDRGGINLATHMRPFSGIDHHLAAEGDPGGLPDHNGNLCVRTQARVYGLDRVVRGCVHSARAAVRMWLSTAVPSPPDESD